MRPLRVGLIGARRARQGLGPFLARDLCAAGAEVPCFQVSRAASVEAARRQLRETAGVVARGYTDLGELLDREALDALVVSSPHESHADVLDAAAEAGLHVLCEKPLLWGSEDLAERAAACVSAFEKRHLALWENCQWPFTLPAFERLHPGSTGAPPARFAMGLRPAGAGAQMLADSLPHPLSLLQRLVPGGAPRVEDVSFSETTLAPECLEVRFRYRAGAAACVCTIELRPTRSHPRTVWLALDERRAERSVSAADYRLSFRDGSRSVPFEDPMSELVRAFVTSLQRGGEGEAARARHREIVERMALLDRLRSAWQQAAA